MPSPPLVPDDGPIDLEHLGRMTLGDAGLEREVLAMFAAQAVSLIGTLATLPPDAGALAHTLKGSARAIGAFAVADAAGRPGSRDAEGRRSGPGARRAQRRGDGGARGHRRDPAPILTLPPWIAVQTAPQVFAPTAGAERIDPL